MPRNKFTACLQCLLRRILDPAAAGNLHTQNRHRLNVVVSNDLCQLFRVIHGIQLRTADQRYFAFYEFLVEVTISVGSTIGCNQKLRSVEKRRVYRHKLDLDRPLGKPGNRLCRSCRNLLLGCCLHHSYS